MTAARYLIGDVFDRLATLEPASVDCVITSPPYYRQRSYLPPAHDLKPLELGQEDTPGLFLENLLSVMDALWPVMTTDATYWVNLGDKHWGSGGAGGDYNVGGLRDGQPTYGKLGGGGGPLDQSVCWLPHLFGASLAYGRNLLTGGEHRQWVTRPAVTWCKPAPPVGRLTRTFRTGTELIVYGGKHQEHYFDLDSVRYEAPPENKRKTWSQNGPKQRLAGDKSDPRTGRARFTQRTVNPNGAPPLNWWVVGAGPGYAGEHFATYPPELLEKPVIAGCPPGGTVLDPFAGSGTTLAVATGHGRNAIGIDLDERNAQLAVDRVGPLILTVEHPAHDQDVPA